MRRPTVESRPLIDVIGHTRLDAPLAIAQALLPGHPWLGDGWPAGGPALEPGAGWVACADLVVEDRCEQEAGYRRSLEDLGVSIEPRLYLVGLLAQARHDGRPIPRSEIGMFASRSHGGGLLKVIDAGAPLEVVGLVDDYDPEFDWGSIHLDLRMGDGRAFRHRTGSYRGRHRFAAVWNDLPAQAVVVPTGHPFATDPALVAAALARIDETSAADLAANSDRVRHVRP